MIETVKRRLKEIEQLMGMDADQPKVVIQVTFVNPGDHKVTLGPRFVLGSRAITEDDQ
jgi:hypothetical protein